MHSSDIKKAYFIGIKGAGMVAVAELLHRRGVKVTGSDTSEVFFTDAILKRLGIDFAEKFSAENVPGDVDVIVHSTAYNTENNVEMAAATKKAVPLVSYPEMLAMIFREQLGIAVCGSHGKTTTTALLASALKNAGLDPSAIVGSQVIAWQGSVLAGGGDYIVAEADEYQNKLRYYDPWAVILTSVDWDHPDYYPTFESYKDAFRDFVMKIPKTGFLTVWGDSASTVDVAKSSTASVHTYGFGEENSYRIMKHEVVNEAGLVFQSFEIINKEQSLGKFQTQLLGKHNVLNCAAVVATTHAIGADMEKVREALREFKGTTRRFELIGERNGAILIDDYAHHPDEIKATLLGARQKYADKNIWVVFHPHTFTRTKALLHEFAQSFDDADKVIVIDIYGSAREEQGGVSSEELVKLMNRYNFDKAEYIPTINETIEFLKDKIGSQDVVIVMGAGDVWKVADKLKS